MCSTHTHSTVHEPSHSLTPSRLTQRAGHASTHSLRAGQPRKKRGNGTYELSLMTGRHEWHRRAILLFSACKTTPPSAYFRFRATQRGSVGEKRTRAHNLLCSLTISVRTNQLRHHTLAVTCHSTSQRLDTLTLSLASWNIDGSWGFLGLYILYIYQSIWPASLSH